ncbi:leucine-rich repeat domain-containing protein [Cytophagaceae bacterium DM2B3-1]|uniref:Leucine-rich repeat domain-containing protein n=1 Tax=Xanthocytophaga flava TaxID=3048013 RepID=A0ABT7CPB9_9BACT|nr:leucine-rich repeat domain-containing protein [Xanthocytophaga flavus]MDJ1473020.1 leucine-rich repeat domain-containing protein [Xanthocytophaga flavus]MDJ1495366.1 leucine-rich repeat domain-containing protein [Xanthocytophaga flavus]
MSYTPQEKENVFRLLQSGQTENIELGLEIAKSLEMNIQDFITDTEIIYEWLMTGVGYQAWEMSLTDRFRITYATHLVSLSFLFIYDIPAEIRHMTQLTELHLSDNYIKSLPLEIGALINLKIISLARNQLNSLPSTFFRLKQLELVNLEGNELQKILIEIGNMHSLQILNLQNNQLTYLPEEIRELTNLSMLELSGNPMNTDIVTQIQSWLPNCMVMFPQ